MSGATIRRTARWEVAETVAQKGVMAKHGRFFLQLVSTIDEQKSKGAVSGLRCYTLRGEECPFIE